MFPSLPLLSPSLTLLLLSLLHHPTPLHATPHPSPQAGGGGGVRETHRSLTLSLLREAPDIFLYAEAPAMRELMDKMPEFFFCGGATVVDSRTPFLDCWYAIDTAMMHVYDDPNAPQIEGPPAAHVPMQWGPPDPSQPPLPANQLPANQPPLDPSQPPLPANQLPANQPPPDPSQSQSQPSANPQPAQQQQEPITLPFTTNVPGRCQVSVSWVNGARPAGRVVAPSWHDIGRYSLAIAGYCIRNRHRTNGTWTVMGAENELDELQVSVQINSGERDPGYLKIMKEGKNSKKPKGMTGGEWKRDRARRASDYFWYRDLMMIYP